MGRWAPAPVGARRAVGWARAAWPALALVAAGLPAAGCGGHRSNPPPAQAATPRPTPTRQPPDDTDLLRALLNARAAATLRGDAAALARTSVGAQRRRDRRIARAAAPLPIAHLTMTAQASDLTRRRAVLHVETIYAFRRVHSRFVKHSRVIAVRTAAGWRVKRDREQGVKAPWEVGRYAVHRSRHFLALAPRGLAVSSLMSDLEAGRTLMHQGLPDVRPPRRMLVLVTRGETDARALTHAVRSLGSLTAIAEAQVTMRGPARRVSWITGQRILVMWPAYGDRTSAERRMVMAHELTHAALARRTSGRIPAWLVEGIAMYASGDQRSANAGALLAGAQLKVAGQQSAAERELSLRRLARPNAMNRLAPIPLAVAYSYASAVAFAIAEEHGRSALLRLYDAFDDEHIRGHAGPRLDDRVLRRVLHESLRSVQADAEAFARAH